METSCSAGVTATVDEKPVPHGQSDAVSAAKDHSDETAGGDDGTADIEGAKPVEAADPALSDGAGTAARDASKPSQTGEGTARKRSRRGQIPHLDRPVNLTVPPGAIRGEEGRRAPAPAGRSAGADGECRKVLRAGPNPWVPIGG